jgi:hypothetical protein
MRPKKFENEKTFFISRLICNSLNKIDIFISGGKILINTHPSAFYFFSKGQLCVIEGTRGWGDNTFYKTYNVWALFA